MADSSIEWTDKVWNPVRGCARVSPGCTHCYAEVMAARFSDPGMWGHGFAERTEHGARWTRKVSPVPEKLAEPLHWRKPVRVFVNSTSDLFHEDVPDEFIAAVFGVMAASPQHTFQCLTKRAERMARWFGWAASQRVRGHVGNAGEPVSPVNLVCAHAELATMPPLKSYADVLTTPFHKAIVARTTPPTWPLPNVWIGVSVEDQQRADERIPHLLRCPAAVRFLSCEPLLGPVSIERHLYASGVPGHCFSIDGDRWHAPGECVGAPANCSGRCCSRTIGWVIVGGESGPGARPFDLAWARSIVAQCKAAGIPVFVKQLGARPFDPARDEYGHTTRPALVALRSPKGGDPAEWPADLRVREFPEAT